MTNPVSLRGRGIEVLESYPSTLQDHKMVFFGTNGYSAPLPAQGQTMDGVLHLMTNETLAKINPLMEGSSDLCDVKATKEGKLIDCKAHILNRQKKPASGDKLPKENYLAILIEGAKHFGMPSSYIEMLGQHECRPRRTPDQFMSYPAHDQKQQYTMADVKAKGNTSGQDGMPCLAAFGTHVVEYMGPRSGSNWGLVSGKALGKNFVFQFSRLEYDPKYGIATSYSDMSPEMKGYYEDWLLSLFGGPAGVVKIWKPIGILVDA